MPTFNDSIGLSGEADRFTVELVAGRTYYFDAIGGSPQLGALADPMLALYGSGRIPLALDDDGGVGLDARIVFTASFTGSYQIEVRGYGTTTGSYKLTAYEDDLRNSVEGIGAAGVVATGGSATGTLNYSDNASEDADIFETVLVNGLTYTIEQRGSATNDGTLSLPRLQLYDTNGTFIGSDYSTGSQDNASLTYTALATGTHFVRAMNVGNVFETGTYRVVVSEGRGTGGVDTIVASSSNDAINGLGGADTIRGLGGADRLTGSTGADVLIGGLGADTFRFVTASDSAGTIRDQIRAGDGAVAFEGAGAAAGDRIDLAGIDANTGVSGNQAFLFGGSGRGHLTLTTEGTNTVIHGNTDSDAAYEFDLVIVDGSVSAGSYTAADFLL